MKRFDGDVALVLAICLAVGSVTAAVAGAAGLSILVGLVTVPVALYAAAAAPTLMISVALVAAFAGVAVIVYWLYVFVTAIEGSS